MKARASSATVFVNCFRVFGTPGWTPVRAIHMISQMSPNAELILTSVYLVDVMFNFL